MGDRSEMTDFDELDEEHRATYAAFLTLLKWSLVLVAVALVGLAVFTI